MITGHDLISFDGAEARLNCSFTARERRVAVEAIVMVTQRSPNDALYDEIREKMDANAGGAPLSLKRIGDCEAPAIIAAAIHAGHRYARELDTTPDADNPLRHERIFT